MRSLAGNTVSVGIVGGGRGGLELLRTFARNVALEVLFICDPNLEAIGVLEAQKLNITTITSMDEGLAMNAEFIFEATRSEQVYKHLQDNAPEGTQIINHKVALMLFKLVSAQALEDMIPIRDLIVRSMRGVNEQVETINDITERLQMTGLNARIEAARIGQQGAGFAVVAKEVQKAAQSVKLFAKEIATINGEIMQVADRIDDTINKMNQADDNNQV